MMRYVLLIALLILKINLAIACSPDPTNILPGESPEEAYEREMLEEKKALYSEVRNNSKHAELVSDSIIVAEIEEITSKTSLWYKVQSLFSKDYFDSYNHVVKLRISSVKSTGKDPFGIKIIKLKKVGDFCGGSYITSFKDKQRNKHSMNWRSSQSYDVGYEYVFFLSGKDLVYSVKKSIFIESNSVLDKKYENLVR